MNAKRLKNFFIFRKKTTKTRLGHVRFETSLAHFLRRFPQRRMATSNAVQTIQAPPTARLRRNRYVASSCRGRTRFRCETATLATDVNGSRRPSQFGVQRRHQKSWKTSLKRRREKPVKIELIIKSFALPKKLFRLRWFASL